MKRFLFLPAICILFVAGCRNHKSDNIIIFHAASLSVPLKEIATEYRKNNHGIKILLEPAGSIDCARRVTELKKPCDIIASADYFVIDELLMPEYAGWGIRFATNEIVIAYSEKSKYSSEIDESNWMDILLRKDVIYARSDPDSDPCGYRSVLTFMLAEKYYGIPGLAEKLISKNKDFIRPNEVDLVALVELNAADYMFQYKSVALQHNFKYLELPDDINLSNIQKNSIYRTVSVLVRGNSPTDKIRITGEYINYSVTVLKNAVNTRGAINFLEFMLGPAGMNIFRKCGQDPLIPASTGQPDKIPAELTKYLKSK